MLFKRPGIHPGNNIDTHTLGENNCSTLLTGALSLLFTPLRQLSELQPEGFCCYSALSHGSITTNPAVSPFFSESQILILKKPYKRPHDLLLCLCASSPSTPFPSLPSYPGPSCCSDTTRNLISAVLLMPPYHRRFPDPAEEKDSILSLPRSPSSRN